MLLVSYRSVPVLTLPVLLGPSERPQKRTLRGQNAALLQFHWVSAAADARSCCLPACRLSDACCMPVACLLRQCCTLLLPNTMLNLLFCLRHDVVVFVPQAATGLPPLSLLLPLLLPLPPLRRARLLQPLPLMPLLPAACCLLPVLAACCLLLAACCLLLAACCLLPAARCLMPDA